MSENIEKNKKILVDFIKWHMGRQVESEDNFHYLKMSYCLKMIEEVNSVKHESELEYFWQIADYWI